jgi:hypothetical protein
MTTELSHYSYVIVPLFEMSDNKLHSILVISCRLKRHYDPLPLATDMYDMSPMLLHAVGTRVKVVMASSRLLLAYTPSQGRLPSCSLKLWFVES